MSDDAEKSVEDRVQERAYALWQQAGQPAGRDDEFWNQAMDEITAELLAKQDDVLDEARKDDTPEDTP